MPQVISGESQGGIFPNTPQKPCYFFCFYYNKGIHYNLETAIFINMSNLADIEKKLAHINSEISHPVVR